ncbi:MAG TPA: hypothetical protein PK390_06720, partial [Fervidobacterium nodosum]|nr:hypothetical protein [Fervidobacterium nodosum]
SWSCNTYFDFVAFWNRALTDEEAITYSQLDYPVYHSTTCKGRFHVALDKLGINPASDDFVIYLWKKPIIGNTGSEYTTSGGNYITIGYPYSGGYISFGKLEYTDKLRVFVRYSDNSTGQATATLPSDYWENWHQEVFIKSGSTIKYYFDGSLKITFNLSKPLHSTFSYGLNFGGYESYYVTPCIVANMLVAKFDSSIWTDDYINELYQAKKAFLGQ